MSQENVEVVQAGLDAYNAGEDWIKFFDSEATLHDPPEWVDRTVHRGHDGIRHASALWTENFSEFRWDIERLIGAGDRVAALVTQRGRIKQSGAWVEQPVGAVFELRDGKTTHLSIYFSWDEALKAVARRSSVSANLDLVRSIYADWERGDYSSARWADTEIEYTVDDFGPLVSQTSTGLTGMAEGARSIIDVFELARIEADGYRELDAERVLVLDRRSGTWKQSGIAFGASTALPMEGTHLFHCAHQKVTRPVMYSDRDRALAELAHKE